MQQVDNLLHLFLGQRPVFHPLYAAVLIQHDNRRALFLQLPGLTGDAVAVDDKLRPRIELLLLSRLERTNIPEPGMASSVFTIVVVW
jgi:hypothetical protein